MKGILIFLPIIPSLKLRRDELNPSSSFLGSILLNVSFKKLSNSFNDLIISLLLLLSIFWLSKFIILIFKSLLLLISISFIIFYNFS